MSVGVFGELVVGCDSQLCGMDVGVGFLCRAPWISVDDVFSVCSAFLVSGDDRCCGCWLMHLALSCSRVIGL